MQQRPLTGLDVAIIGGDRREVVLAEEFIKKGAKVWLYGFAQYKLPINKLIKQGIPAGADIIILPLPGVLNDHSIYSAYAAEKIYFTELNPLLQADVLLFCGRIPEHLRQSLQEQGIRLIITSQLEELAVINAVPTAEGVLEIALRESQITLNHSSVLITGFGSCAQQLARVTAALGAEVTIAARKRKDLATAAVLGYIAVTFDKLAEQMADIYFIFNSVPALVLSKDILAKAQKYVLIYDIASAPGGTDFAAARALGLQEALLPGLPGIVAPLTVCRM